MKRTVKLLALILTLLLAVMAFVSCASASDADYSSDYENSYPKDEGYDNDYTGGAEFAPDDSVTGDGATTGTSLEQNRKIIKTVNESVQTDAYDDFMESLAEAVRTSGGYISSRTERGGSYGSDSLRYTSMTIRIPAENLDAFTARVKSLAVVTSYYESVNDVTEAYIDVESRIAVLEAEETALTEMLAQSPDVSTLLEIRKRLLEVQSDLASLRAQKNSYDDRIAYSTVYLSIDEVKRAVEKKANPSFFEEVGDNFSNSLYDIGQSLRAIGVWLLGDSLYILITLAIIAAVVFAAVFLTRRYLHKYRAKNAKKPEDQNKTDKTE